MNIQDIWSNTLQLVGQAWWVEITTDQPHCIYYFGPFSTEAEADNAKAGYIEDLESEQAQGINVVIKRCKPTEMTIEHGAVNGKVKV
jgi:S-formylglutathione hydrolase FrmB